MTDRAHGAASVTKKYKAPFPFVGGSLKSATIDVSGAHYRNLEMEVLAMLSRE